MITQNKNFSLKTLPILAILFSSISFILYGGFLFKSSKMQSEFKRFGLEKFTKLTALLELLGGIGLLVGLKFSIILLISSGGLALLMLLGLGIRLKVKDGFLISFPSFFYMILNLFIFIITLKIA